MINQKIIKAKKVILATGAPKTLPQYENRYENVTPINIYDALNPKKLGVERIINFYLLPIRVAVRLNDWILYDNTG